MAGPGRNERCPCGSGKKFKHCCGRGRAAVVSYTREDREAAYEALLHFAARDEFADVRERANVEYWEDLFDADAPPHVRELAESDWNALGFMLFLTVDLSVHGEERAPQTVLDLFLERESTDLPPAQRRFLTDLSKTWVGLYRVAEVRPGKGLTLLDYWSDQTIVVRERTASKTIARHEILAARLITTPDGHVELNGDMWSFPPDLEEEILDEAVMSADELGLQPEDEPRRFGRDFAPGYHRLFWDLRMHAPMPTLQTSTGQPLEFHHVKLALSDADAVVAALDACDELARDPNADHPTWVWLSAPDQDIGTVLGHLDLKGDHLLLETMSAERSDRGRRLIESVGGKWIRGASKTVESGADLMRRAIADREPAPAPGVVDTPEAWAIVARIVDQHYRAWPDIPVPALGNRTPRDAAADPDTAEDVARLLRHIEHTEAAKGRRGEPVYDCGWMWEELGLADRR